MGLIIAGITILGLLLLNAAWVIFPPYAPYFKVTASLLLGWFATATLLSFRPFGRAPRSPLGGKVVYLAAGLYASFSFGASLLKHWTFRSNALDLGMMDQVVWNTLQGRPFYTSLKDMSFLGEHFSPILAVFSPLYLIFSNVSLLLLAQSLSISASGLVLFHIARVVIRQEHGAAALVLAYYLSPFLLNAHLFDFQPDKLEPPFIILAFLGLYRGSYLLYGGSLSTLMLIKEDGGL